jgi:glutamate dehydrogenase
VPTKRSALQRRRARAADRRGDAADRRALRSLIDERGEERGNDLFRRYRHAFSTGYCADWVARSAVADIERIEQLHAGDGLGMSLYRPLEARGGDLRCKLLRADAPISLSDVLPMFETMGLEVADERPYEIRPRDGAPTWIYDFALTHPDGELEIDNVREAFQDAFARVWRGEVESDGFNALVLRAGLTWREITILRAIARYLRQAGTTFSNHYIEQALIAHADVARSVVELFVARFGPRRDRDDRAAEAAARRIEEAIDAVESLDEDRILRYFLDVVRDDAAHQLLPAGRRGRPKPYSSFKLDPARIPLVPLPRPRFEIFVYSPRTEGVHLRGGKVARGGLRWSDRREDFRTEILGLVKAQMVNNAVIVPVGAKGGFMVKRPPAEREALLDEVVACYRMFISALLDLSDTIADGEVVPPRDVVRYDEDDPPGSTRSPPSTSCSAGACTCTGWATRSPSCRARTGGRRWRGPRCATTCSACVRS